MLIVLALIAIVGDIRHGPGHDAHPEHEHRSGVVWLLVVPVALLAFAVPPALDPQSARPAISHAADEAPHRPFPALQPNVRPSCRCPKCSSASPRAQRPALELCKRRAIGESNPHKPDGCAVLHARHMVGAS